MAWLITCTIRVPDTKPCALVTVSRFRSKAAQTEARPPFMLLEVTQATEDNLMLFLDVTTSVPCQILRDDTCTQF